MYRLFTTIASVAMSLVWVSCGNMGGVNEVAGERDSMHYAQYLSICHFDDYTIVEIKNPWDSTKTLQRYTLIPKGEGDDKGNIAPGTTVVEVPIQQAVVYNSVHASIVEMLGALESIAGVCEVQYIDSEELRERVTSGRVADIGESTAPNVERIIDIHTDAILSSPFKDAGYGAVEKLRIPIIEGADYMEQHPLGRVEWIKLYGELFDRREQADSIFDAACREYLQLKAMVAHVEHRPTVMAERRYGSQWFVPARGSYNATLFADAGADYIFSDLEGSGSVPLSFERVLDRGIESSVWVLKYNSTNGDMSYDDLRSEYEPYANFTAFKTRSVYGCNTAHKRYYQDIPMAPHLLLREYIYIFHPELLPDFTPHYFAPLID
ncbi:MAG: ABC transporter substrate-binding protein [Rikenellaceae bacterium]